MTNTPKRRFFSGSTLEAALVTAASEYGIPVEEIAYKEIEKRHGFLRVRRNVVIEVDPESPRRAASEKAPKIAAIPERRTPPPLGRHEDEPKDAASEKAAEAETDDSSQEVTKPVRPRRRRGEPVAVTPDDDDEHENEQDDDEDRPFWDVEEEGVYAADEFDGEDDDEDHEDDDEDDEQGNVDTEDDVLDREEAPSGRPARRRRESTSEPTRKRESTPREPSREQPRRPSRDDHAEDGDSEGGRRRSRRRVRTRGPVRERKELVPIEKRLKEGRGEEADAVIEATEWLLDLVDVDVDPRVYQGEERYEVELRGTDRDVLVSDDGKVLTAIEHLLPRVLHGVHGEALPVRVDSENYQEGREERLRETAFRMAEEVRASGMPEVLEPMDPADRRIVHLALGDEPEVETRSLGSGFFKRVKIVPVEP